MKPIIAESINHINSIDLGYSTFKNVNITLKIKGYIEFYVVDHIINNRYDFYLQGN